MLVVMPLLLACSRPKARTWAAMELAKRMRYCWALAGETNCSTLMVSELTDLTTEPLA